MKALDWKQNLIVGYQNFRTQGYKQHKSLYEQVGKHGQNPDAMVIACSDSRADPAIIFNAYPGEIFVLRNVANIVPPYDISSGYHGTSAAIEFAVTVLNVSAIVVMGHESCGGVAGYLDSLDNDTKTKPDQECGHSFLNDWIQILDAAHVQLAATDAKNINSQRHMEYAGVRQSLVNLMSFPFIEKAVAAGDLSLLGAYFSIIEGRLLFVNKEGVFEEVPTCTQCD